MSADVLRRAAKALRSPYLCNWDPAVSSALADLIDAHAVGVDARIEAETHVGVPAGAIRQRDEVAAVDLAAALLRSWGHDCADRPDEPCRTCELVPKPMPGSGQ